MNRTAYAARGLLRHAGALRMTVAALVVAAAVACAVGIVNPGAADAAQAKLTTTSTNGLISGHTYVIKSSVGNGMVLDISGASKKNGANAQVYASNGTNAQKWVYKEVGNGYATLSCVASGKMLDVRSARTANGTNVWQYQSNGTNAQKWRITKNSDGTCTITSALSSKRVLDVSGARNKSGTNVQIYQANGTKAQKWTFVDLTPSKTTAAPALSVLDKLAKQGAQDAKAFANKTLYISSAVSGKMVLDVSGASKANSANVQIYRYNQTSAQRWKITFDSLGYATLTNGSGKVLDVSGAGKTNGTNVQQYASNGTLAQKWIFSKNADGTWTILSALKSNFALDLCAGSAVNGTNVQVYAANGTAAQKWRLQEKIEGFVLPDQLAKSFAGIDMTGVKAVGIDVSQWQRNIDWAKVAGSGVDFAIIRCGYGSDYTSQDDPYFLKNIREARAAGLDVGVYLYSYALNKQQASSEADHTLRLIRAAGLKPADLKYGVSYDIEDPSQQKLWLLPLCQEYARKIQAAGYGLNIYSYLNWWNTKLTDKDYESWGRYIAQWKVNSCSYAGTYRIWQCSSTGSVPGISGAVDMDVAY